MRKSVSVQAGWNLKIRLERLSSAGTRPGVEGAAPMLWCRWRKSVSFGNARLQGRLLYSGFSIVNALVAVGGQRRRDSEYADAVVMPCRSDRELAWFNLVEI
jgi:hypothetical protein